MLNFNRTAADAELIRKLVEWARRNWPGPTVPSRMDLEMDITAVHCNGTPLRLFEMVSAIDAGHAGSVMHDITGIRRYLDRTTGELTDCFVPRFAAPEVSSGNECTCDEPSLSPGLIGYVQCGKCHGYKEVR